MEKSIREAKFEELIGQTLLGIYGADSRVYNPFYDSEIVISETRKIISENRIPKQFDDAIILVLKDKERILHCYAMHHRVVTRKRWTFAK